MVWWRLPFLFGENWRPFVLGDLFIVVDTYHQVITHGLGLSQRIGMAKMDHVIAARDNMVWSKQRSLGGRLGKLFCLPSITPHSDRLFTIHLEQLAASSSLFYEWRCWSEK